MKTVLSNRPFAPATENQPQPDNGQTLCYTRAQRGRGWDAFIQAYGNKRVPIEKEASLPAIQQKAKESGRKLVYVAP